MPSQDYQFALESLKEQKSKLNLLFLGNHQSGNRESHLVKDTRV
jgi:hypothetical protein